VTNKRMKEVEAKMKDKPTKIIFPKVDGCRQWNVHDGTCSWE